MPLIPTHLVRAQEASLTAEGTWGRRPTHLDVHLPTDPGEMARVSLDIGAGGNSPAGRLEVAPDDQGRLRVTHTNANGSRAANLYEANHLAGRVRQLPLMTRPLQELSPLERQQRQQLEATLALMQAQRTAAVRQAMPARSQAPTGDGVPVPRSADFLPQGQVFGAEAP